MTATANGRIVRRKKFRASEIPDALVHEIMDGRPLYRRGYLEVMNKTKQIEDIMGSGRLQFTLVDYLLGLLYAQLDRKKYLIATNEAGLHLERRNNLSNDIAIFEKARFDSSRLEKGYARVSPVVNIEIDTDIEHDQMPAHEYIQRKTQKLLDFGSERVIWFFTMSEKVMVAEPGRPWLTMPWATDIELLEGIKANIGRFLEDEGFVITE